jgi:hypothetical protein
LSQNDRLPYGGNDGPLWASRGLNARVTGGVALQAKYLWAALDVVAAPTMVYSQNQAFFVPSGLDSARSRYSSPWHVGQSSADLPLRFGDQPIRHLSFGESSATLTLGPVAGGASTASEWWGPGRYNTLLLSSNAPGIPRGFIRTSHPLRSRIGWIDFYGFAGMLSESRFFDTVSTNNYRSVSGFRLTYRPAGDSGLTLGLARLSTTPVGSRGTAFPQAFNVLTIWEPLATPADTFPDGHSRQRADQLLELFFHWSFPESGFETYVEWARIENPRSWNEWLTAPYSTQGYTMGLQWASEPRWRNGRLRIEGEVSYLEQTQVFADRPPPDFYTGRTAVHGWTNEGQVLGAATGPGSSTQHLGFDWLGGSWRAGGFVGRTRWENDALYRQPSPTLTQHDVTIYSGVRGAVRLPWYDLSGNLTVGRRLNYLFQNDALTPEFRHAIDVQNVTLSILLSPR